MLYKMENFSQNFDFHILLTMGFVASQYGHTYFPKKMPHTLDNLIVAGGNTRFWEKLPPMSIC